MSADNTKKGGKKNRRKAAPIKKKDNGAFVRTPTESRTDKRKKKK